MDAAAFTLPAIRGVGIPLQYSFRLYFRSLYGNCKFSHSILEKFPEIDYMDTFVLRAGTTMTPTLCSGRNDAAAAAFYRTSSQLGTFVNLFINGDYKGYYNLCERVDEDFCQHGLTATRMGHSRWVAPASGSSYLEPVMETWWLSMRSSIMHKITTWPSALLCRCRAADGYDGVCRLYHCAMLGRQLGLAAK
jgi:hypothetical protein